MAVHNGEAYLTQAVESILSQTFQDFEFLIIDDASTDQSHKMLSGFNDERVRLIAHSHKLGLSSSLNEGIELALGDYIARMDHDDICRPQRLKRQVDFMDVHMDVDVLGTWAQTIGLPRQQTWRYSTVDEDIRSEFVFNSGLVHSSVMLRKATLERLQLRYDDSVAQAQDYELWTRAAPRIRFANLDMVLVNYRVHPDQVGNKYGVGQQAAADKVRLREIEGLGIKPTKNEFALHNRISRWEQISGRAELEDLERWFLKLRAANGTSKVLSMAAFDRALERRWWAACKANIGTGNEAWRVYKRAQFARGAKRSPFEKAQFWAKGILREMGWRR
jgi:glycosyltransferase involved in cell wall biosynthesis